MSPVGIHVTVEMVSLGTTVRERSATVTRCHANMGAPVWRICTQPVTHVHAYICIQGTDVRMRSVDVWLFLVRMMEHVSTQV